MRIVVTLGRRCRGWRGRGLGRRARRLLGRQAWSRFASSRWRFGFLANLAGLFLGDLLLDGDNDFLLAVLLLLGMTHLGTALRRGRRDGLVVRGRIVGILGLFRLGLGRRLGATRGATAQETADGRLLAGFRRRRHFLGRRRGLFGGRLFLGSSHDARDS